MPNKNKAKPNIPASQQNPQNPGNPVSSAGHSLKKSMFMRKSFFMWLLIFSAVGLVSVLSVFIMLYSMMPSPQPVVPAVVTLPSPAPSPLPSPSPTPAPTPTPEPTPDPMLGMVLSPFTGLPIPEESEHLRPVAVVVNNHSRALPQSGISEAEIIYEVLAEGNITRLVAVFHQLKAEKIGPVRSTRDYFADFAIDNDAILAHHGGSPSGYARLRNLGLDGLDGMQLEGSVFWRDPERWRVPAMREHSSYTGAEQLENGMANRNVRRDRRENDGLGFAFNFDEIPFDLLAKASGGAFRPCIELTVPFSNGYPRRFVYNPRYSKFAVYNVHGPHIDGNIENAEEAQLHVTNILVQHVRMRTVDGEGRREVTTVGSGNGYLATAGGIVSVRWVRDSHSSPTRWYFVNGQPLQLNPGKTWICLLSDNIDIQVVSLPERPAAAEEVDDNEAV